MVVIKENGLYLVLIKSVRGIRTDDNLRNNLCPDPHGSANSAAWELAKAVALEAVLNTENFLDETKNLASALFYTSKITPYWEDDPDFVKYGPVNIKLNFPDLDDKSLKVYNQNVHNPNCVKLYRNKKYLESINKIKNAPHKYYSGNIMKLWKVPAVLSSLQMDRADLF
ncbi:MAG TPA: hypothetical protein VIG33_12100 [Pseudobdellovibrionaceae bacterium]